MHSIPYISVMKVLRTRALFQHRFTLNMIKFQLSNGRCSLHSEHVCEKSITGDRTDCLFLIWLVRETGSSPIIKSKRGLAWSVLLSTMVFVITVVKMLWAHETQPRQVAVDLLLSQFRRQIRWFVYAWELIKALCDTLTRAALSTLLSRTANRPIRLWLPPIKGEMKLFTWWTFQNFGSKCLYCIFNSSYRIVYRA